MDSTTDWITAIAAVFAALGTVGALIFTARVARSAAASANAANRGLLAAGRPLLLDVPYEHYTDPECEYSWRGEIRKAPIRGQILVDATNGTFVFAVRNVGRGPARIDSFSIALADDGADYSEFAGVVVPAGGDIWLAGDPDANAALVQRLRTVPSPVHGPLPYLFTVAYTDVAGKQRQRLVLGVGTAGQDSALRVLRVEHVSLDD